MQYFAIQWSRILFRATAILVSLATLFGVPLGDTFTPGTFPIIEPAAKADDAVRVMSFNIRYSDVNDVPAVLRRNLPASQIAQVQPDSFGVQEAKPDWMAALRGRLPQYAAVGEGRDGNGRGEHNAVFYLKEKYTCVDSGTFWLSETPDKPSKALDAGCRRVCTWVVLENKETKQRYAHVNSHFDNTGAEARIFEAEMVQKFISETFPDIPVVFTADLNCFATEKAYAIMTRELTDARTMAEDVEDYATFHDGRPGTDAEEHIDFILLSPQLRALSYKTVTSGIDGRLVSDHFPIYADFVFAN